MTADLTPEITCRKAIAPGVPQRELWVEVLVNGKYHSSHPTIVDAHDRMRDIKATYAQHRQHGNKHLTTVHYFAKKLVKSQIDALADCDYDDLLDIHPDRVERASERDDGFSPYMIGDARETLCHIIGTRLDIANEGVLDGEAGARNFVSQLERLMEAVGLTHRDVVV